MAHGVVRMEIEIAVSKGRLPVDIHFKLRTPPCGDSVYKTWCLSLGVLKL